MKLVFDIEGDGLYEKITKVWCICTKDVDTGEVRFFGPEEIRDGVDWLNSAELLIGHNIIDFDLPALVKLGYIDSDLDYNVLDTLVFSRLLNPDRQRPAGYPGKAGPHALDTWGYRVGRYKPSHEDWSQYSEEMKHRCMEDVEINYLTYRHLEAEAHGHDWSQALEIEQKIAGIISRQARAGVYFDLKAAQKAVQELSERVEDIDSQLKPILPVSAKTFGVEVKRPFLKTGRYSKMVTDWMGDIEPGYVGGPFSRVYYEEMNINSDVQVKNFLLSQGWVPISWNFNDDGEPTSPKLEFSDDGSDGIKSGVAKLIKDRKLWTHRRSQIEGWISSRRPDGTIPAAANPCGTPTGRMRHAIVVNVPKAVDWVPFGKEMRSLFIARPGRVLVGYDAEQLELRMLAHYLNDEDYTNAILSGDIHSHNQQLAGLPTRDDAKTFIYAFNYGAGDAKIGSIVGGDSRDGKRLRQEFLRSCPALERLIKSVKRAASRGFLLGLDGRRFKVRRGNDGRLQLNKGLNILLQGAGAIVMKQSAILLDQWVREEGLDAIKVIDMHDEAQWDVNPKDVDRFKELAELCIVKAGEHFQLNIPLAGEAKVGHSWAETH